MGWGVWPIYLADAFHFVTAEPSNHVTAYQTVQSLTGHLFVYDAAKKVVAKDESPGPSCDIKFTAKEAGKYTLEVVNLGPGDNKSTLKVEFAKAKE